MPDGVDSEACSTTSGTGMLGNKGSGKDSGPISSCGANEDTVAAEAAGGGAETAGGGAEAASGTVDPVEDAGSNGDASEAAGGEAAGGDAAGVFTSHPLLRF
jgi:hypothetical protein